MSTTTWIQERGRFTSLDWVVYYVLTLVQVGAIGCVGWLWFASDGWADSPLMYSLLTVLLLSFVGAQSVRWYLLPKMRVPVPIAPKPGLRVTAVTTFVPGGEPIEMLEETVRAMVAMDYPHDTWVLDEGDTDEARELCERLGAKHYSRKGIEKYQQEDGVFKKKCKHGNYNAFFDSIGYDAYDIITGFDPDHVPEQSFLMRVLGYFRDPEVGYVQLPQVYYNQEAGFIARGGAEETYSYYDTLQPAAHGGGWPIVTGCHHTHRVSALREIGGFAPHDADDMMITYCYRQGGYRGVYSPEVQARGITPVDWQGYLQQQYRWARSVLDLKLRVQPKMKLGLPLSETIICYLHGFYYVRGVINLVGVLLLIYMMISGNIPALAKSNVFLVVLAMIGIFMFCDYYRQRFFLDRRQIGLNWRATVLEYAKWPVMLAALVDVLINRKRGYTLTRKAGLAKRPWALIAPHALIVTAMLSAYAYALAVGNRNFPVEAWVLLLSTMSLGLIATAWIKQPEPYQRSLWLKKSQRPVPEPMHAISQDPLPTELPKELPTQNPTHEVSSDFKDQPAVPQPLYGAHL